MNRLDDVTAAENLIKIDDDITNDNYGHYPDKRSIESLLYYGLVLVDKPAGPTSHEVVAWIKRILGIEKAGHSGTLDPAQQVFCQLDWAKAPRRSLCCC